MQVREFLQCQYTCSCFYIYIIYRCGGVYCSVHRYAESHSCTFNYKAEGKQTIARNNPLVTAPKLSKIWFCYFAIIINELDRPQILLFIVGAVLELANERTARFNFCLSYLLAMALDWLQLWVSIIVKPPLNVLPNNNYWGIHSPWIVLYCESWIA